MNSWIFVVGGWLIDFAFLATALLLAAALMRSAIRDSGGRVLLAWSTWLGILGGGLLVALPVWPRQEFFTLLGPRAAAIETSTSGPTLEPVIVIQSADMPLPAETSRSARERATANWWPLIAVGGWFAAAMLASGWMIVGFWQARTVVRDSCAAPAWIVDELGKISAVAKPAADVRTSKTLASAVAVCALRPKILLSATSANEKNAAAVRAALAHEWAHIQHGDLWLLAIERLLVPLLALHPFFWWLRRQTRFDQEILADAAAAGQSPVEYAEALVAWAKEPGPGSIGWAGLEWTGLAMWERKHNLSRRVQMILTCKRVGAGWLGRFCGCAAAALVVALAATLSTFTMRELSASDDPPALPVAETGVAVEPAAGARPATPPAEPAADRPPTSEKKEYSITLQLTLWALDRGDFPQTRKEALGAAQRIAGRKLQESADAPNTSSSQSRPAKSLELTSQQADELTTELKLLDGVKIVSRATVITHNWQEAQLQVAEPGPQVFFTQELDGKTIQRAGSGFVSYHVSVRPRVVKGNENQVEMTIEASRTKPNTITPQATLTATVDLNRTLFFFGTEPFVILVTPVKVEQQTTSESPQSEIGASPLLPTVSAPPTRVANPLPTLVPALQPAASFPYSPAPTTAAIIPAPPSGAAPILPATPGLPATRPRAVSPLPPVTISPADATASSVEPSANPRVAQNQTPVIANSIPLPVAQTAQSTEEVRQTERRLLELDLAEAKLEVASAEVELAEMESLRKKTPQAVSQQELRKGQFLVERAKIHVKRIEVRLEEVGKARIR